MLGMPVLQTHPRMTARQFFKTHKKSIANIERYATLRVRQHVYNQRVSNQTLKDMSTQELEKIGTIRSLHEIIDRTSQFCNIPLELIVSTTRKREVVEARQVILCLGYKWLDLSAQSVGAMIGGKDHATTLHSAKTVKNLFNTNRVFRQRLFTLGELIGLGEEELREIVNLEKRTPIGLS